MDKFEDILIQNAKEYYKNAIESEKRKQYNSTVTLFFKAISALCDIYILRNEGKMPSNHSERFRILQLKYPKIYKIIDKDFPYYQNSYRARLNKEVSDMFKEDVRELFKILSIGI